MGTRLAARIPAALLAVALGIVAARNLLRLNPDAVAYLRLAGYWAEGNVDLAVAPYWGPLLPWLAAPLLFAGIGPVLAGRIVVAFGGLVFALGVRRLLRSLHLAPVTVLAGFVVAGIFSVGASALAVAPDLLLAGCAAFAASQLVRRGWLRGIRRPLVAGAWLGGMALAKPAGFPMALAILLFSTVLWRLAARARAVALVRSTALAVLALLAISAPWVALVVAQDGWEGLTRTARVNHALVGPDPRAPEHPSSQGFQNPPPGRVTVWEDPTGRGYATWSPLGSWRALRRTAGVVHRNWKLVQPMLARFDRFSLGLPLLLLVFFFHRPWRRRLARQRWRWMLLPAAGCVALYLPVHALSERYYWPAWPFFLAGALGVADRFFRDAARRRIAAVLFAAWAFATPASLDAATAALEGRAPRAASAACDLASRLERAGRRGAVAGERLESLYVAWLLESPWLGYRSDVADAASYLECGAEIVVVRRGSPSDEALCEAGDAYRDLDPLLFPGRNEKPVGADSLLRAFARVQTDSPRTR